VRGDGDSVVDGEIERSDMAHKLIINSLRDTDAVCSCGRWSFVAMAFDRELDHELRARVHDEHLLHKRDWK
jgi:hypothetical protein